jgi:hypothetical protein
LDQSQNKNVHSAISEADQLLLQIHTKGGEITWYQGGAFVDFFDAVGFLRKSKKKASDVFRSTAPISSPIKPTQ